MAYRKHIEIPLSENISVELRERYMDFGKPTEYMRWIAGTTDKDDYNRFIEIPQEHEGTLASALTVAAGHVAEYTKNQESTKAGTKQFHVFTRPLYPSIPGGC